MNLDPSRKSGRIVGGEDNEMKGTGAAEDDYRPNAASSSRNYSKYHTH